MNKLDIVRVKLGKYPIVKRALLPISHWLIDRTKRKLNVQFQKEGMNVFRNICDTLNRHNVRFWPEFGTLLGIYRENGFIKNDFDFDFGAYIEDADEIKEILVRNGFSYDHEYIGIDHPEIRELTVKYKGIFIDFFFFIPKDFNTMVCHNFAPKDYELIKGEAKFKILERKYPLFSLQKAKFKGVDILMPVDINAHLEAMYGPSYMIPDPHYSHPDKNYLDDIEAIIIENK